LTRCEIEIVQHSIVSSKSGTDGEAHGERRGSRKDEGRKGRENGEYEECIEGEIWI
jgi:hypothetical protein